MCTDHLFPSLPDGSSIFLPLFYFFDILNISEQRVKEKSSVRQGLGTGVTESDAAYGSPKEPSCVLHPQLQHQAKCTAFSNGSSSNLFFPQ